VYLTFSVASYNVLASAYIQRAWYPRTPRMALNPAWRRRALVERVVALKADILCLQEVEPSVLAALGARLGVLGYGAQYGRKNGGRPDGCALFFRQQAFTLIDSRVLAYADGGSDGADSGYVALIARFRSARAMIGVVSTHLTWDPPGTDSQLQRGNRQARQLLLEYQEMRGLADAWIVAGDFNVTPDNEIVSMIEQAGFRYAHQGRSGANTCNFNGEPKMIDYLFHSSALAATPQAIAAVDHRTVLPSAEEPSDHVAIMASFEWRDY
jgi:mRNA deadenylase 3'-5' endonuclease subunit Ccr4